MAKVSYLCSAMFLTMAHIFGWFFGLRLPMKDDQAFFLRDDSSSFLGFGFSSFFPFPCRYWRVPPFSKDSACFLYRCLACFVPPQVGWAFMC